MSNILFLDPLSSYLELKDEIDCAVHEVLSSGQYVLGPAVENFEQQWANFCDAKFAVGVANGLDALTLALMALDVGVGDEVIVPAHTFVATWLAVSRVGATPVPVDVLLNTGGIDVDQVVPKITDRTKAIIPVHLYGIPADLSAISLLADKYNLFVIEDAAQAHGATYRERPIGGHSDAVCWSFYPGKNLGAMGDAGAVTTDDKNIAEAIRILRNYGSREKYIHDRLGLNSRMDPVQAAILDVKLKKLKIWNYQREIIYRQYTKKLEPLLRYQNNDFSFDIVGLDTHFMDKKSHHLFVIRTNKRKSLENHLKKYGIPTLVHYPRLPHLQNAYKDHYLNDEFKNSNTLANQVISLPMGPHLSLSDADFVSNAVLNLWGL